MWPADRAAVLLLALGLLWGCAPREERVASLEFRLQDLRRPLWALPDRTVVQEPGVLRELSLDGSELARFAIPAGLVLLTVEGPPYHGFARTGRGAQGALIRWRVEGGGVVTEVPLGPMVDPLLGALLEVRGHDARRLEVRATAQQIEALLYEEDRIVDRRAWSSRLRSVRVLERSGNPYLIIGDPMGGSATTSYGIGDWEIARTHTPGEVWQAWEWDGRWRRSPLPPPGRVADVRRRSLPLRFLPDTPGGPCWLVGEEVGEGHTDDGSWVVLGRLHLVRWSGEEWTVVRRDITGRKLPLIWLDAAWAPEEDMLRVVWLAEPRREPKEKGGAWEVRQLTVPLPQEAD